MPGQIFTRVLLTAKYGLMFTGELESCSEVTISFYAEAISPTIFSRIHLFAAEVSLVGHPVPWRFTACPGTEFAPILQRGNTRDRMYWGT